MEQELLTLRELADRLGYKENTLQRQYVRTVENLAKTGIIIEKYGRGKAARYTLEYKKTEE